MKHPTKAEYSDMCANRYETRLGLNDAIQNYESYVELCPQLMESLKAFKENPYFTDAKGKHLNPGGSLVGFLWQLQETLNPDKSSLYPLLDFEERYQRVFLKRGLVIFCKLCIESTSKQHEETSGAQQLNLV